VTDQVRQKLEALPAARSAWCLLLARGRAVLAVLVLVGCARAPIGPIVRDGRRSTPSHVPEVTRRVLRFESGPTAPSGTLDGSWLAERMQETHTPSVSIALINDSAIEWAHGYGVLAQGEAITTPETLYQAASLSKPVSTFAAMRLVDESKLSLDEDVSVALRNWQVPPGEQTRQRKVTLRSIFTHSSGLTVESFNGYEAGKGVPSLRQILDGKPPANSAPVRVTFTPGSRQRYSGGGFLVLQQVLSDTTQEPFERAMNQLVFTPLEMHRSLFTVQLPPELARDAARGHDPDGNELRGKWHLYPELAAAGLWTTPSDLARFALEVARAQNGESTLLSRTSAGLMTTRQFGRYALGFSVRGAGRNSAFGHAGANAGFRCAMLLFPARGQGAVVMTNGDGGGALVREVMHALGELYGWPRLPQEGPL
jgi:CubicO group peptidase (beta-lactamase class C family)